MKYKIFIKYTSTFKKDFYEVYKVKSEDGQEIEFVTSDLDELKATISELDKIYGHELIRVVIDITYNIDVNVDTDSKFDTATSEEVQDIFNDAYKSVFGEVMNR